MQTFRSDAVAKMLGDGLVVVIEPAPNLRATLKQFLANLHVKNVRFALSTEEARRILLQRKVALFVVEWLMDGQNGLQFKRDLAQSPRTKDIPFLLIAGENLDADIILAAETGVDGYLLKPFSYEDFCAKLVDVLNAKTNTDPVNALVDAAEKHISSGDFAAAERLLAEVLALKPNSARALCDLGKVHLYKGQTEEAVVLLQRAIAENAYFLDSYRTLLQLYEDQKDLKNQLRVGHMLHDLSPENPKYTMILARAYLEDGNLEASEKYFRLTTRVSPQLASAYKGLGDLFLLKEDYTNSRKFYQKALDLDDGDISILNGLGAACVRQGLFGDGIKYYLVALTMDPANNKIKFNIGHAYEKLQDFNRAAHYFQRILKDDPTYEKAKAALERVEKRLKDLS